MRSMRGMTLVEILVTMSLMLLGLAAVFVNIHRRPSQGAAELVRVIVKELRDARARAKATGNPRAFCIPTAGASTPCSQSYYLMSGHGKTAPRKVVDFSQQYSGLYVFVGLWSSTPQSIGSNDPLKAAQWMNPQVRDFVLLFGGDGRLATNDLPRDNQGNSYILVSDGLEFGPGTTPSGTATTGSNPPPYFQLTRVNKPWIIRISSTGIISFGNLLQNPASGLAITQDQPAAPSLAPAPPVVKPAGNLPPVVDRLDGRPLASSVYRPPFDTTIPPDGRASLSLFAYDPDGEDLSYQFSAIPNAGKFSYFSGPRYLRYPNPTVNLGEANSEWMPDAGVPLGSTFRLEVTITDESQNSTTSSLNTTIVDVKVVADGTIAFDSPRGIYSMKGDGTSVRQLTSNAGDAWPELSPDGQNIVFVSSRSDTYFLPGGGVLTETAPRIWTVGVTSPWTLRRVTGVDTTSNTTVNATAGSIDDSPCWSPDGTKILFARTAPGVGGLTRLQIVRLDGSWVKKDLATGTRPCWSAQNPPGGKAILYENGADLWRTDSAGSASPVVANATSPAWSTDGTRFVYWDTTNNTLNEAKPDGSSKSVKNSSAIGRVDFNSRFANFIGVSGGVPYIYTDPGLGSAATRVPVANNSTLPPYPQPLPSPLGPHISWGP